MAWNSVLTSIILLAAGAAIGLIPAYISERDKRRHALLTRWDVPLFDLCRDYTAAARQLLHLSRRYERSTDKEDYKRRIDEQHAKLRTLTAQIRLLGSADLQEAARLVTHHAYAVREVGEGGPDRRLKDYPGTTAEGRFTEALADFYKAARTQLGVANPADVASQFVLPDEPWR
jgi:hypothetical protein